MFVLLFLYLSVKMAYMFEISTASATGVRRLFGSGAYLIFGLTGTALIRERRLFWGGAYLIYGLTGTALIRGWRLIE